MTRAGNTTTHLMNMKSALAPSMLNKLRVSSIPETGNSIHAHKRPSLRI